MAKSSNRFTGRVLPTINPPQPQAAETPQAHNGHSAEEPSIEYSVNRDGSGYFTLSVEWKSGAYHRPIAKATGDMLREVLSQFAPFRALHIGDGLYLQFGLTRGNPPQASAGAKITRK